MLGLFGKTKYFQVKYIPKLSTLSDTNKRRDNEVFFGIYNKVVNQYNHVFGAVGLKVRSTNIGIFDSSTVKLFRDILKYVGHNPVNGKKKD